MVLIERERLFSVWPCERLDGLTIYHVRNWIIKFEVSSCNGKLIIKIAWYNPTQTMLDFNWVGYILISAKYIVQSRRASSRSSIHSFSKKKKKIEATFITGIYRWINSRRSTFIANIYSYSKQQTISRCHTKWSRHYTNLINTPH